MFGSSQWMYNSGSDFTIDQSLRFDGNSTLYLRPHTPGNRKKWTYSVWCKGFKDDSSKSIFSSLGSAWASGQVTQPVSSLRFNAGRLELQNHSGSAYMVIRHTAAYFRDPAAWYHIVCVFDSDNDNEEDRAILYVNGVRITEWYSYTPMSKGFEGYTNAGYGFEIGDDARDGVYHKYDGYLAEAHFVDGQVLTPDYFGVINEDYGHWVPKEFDVSATPKASYGTNGFYLPFSGTFYNDASGNGNNWTANNLAATDVVLDSPTNNFATLNPLSKIYSGLPTFTEGNLEINSPSDYNAESTIAFPDDGTKTYIEIMINEDVGDGGGQAQFGIHEQGNTENPYIGNGTYWLGTDGGAYDGVHGILINGSLLNGAWLNFVHIYAGTLFRLAVWKDGSSWKYYFTDHNGNWIYSDSSRGSSFIEGDPTVTLSSDSTMIFFARNINVNFGQDSSFAGNKTAQNNTDANGRGDFYYAPPSGFLALCTQNLPEPAVIPKENFNTVLYSGNAASTSQNINGVGFSPDLVWLKRRNAVSDHWLFDRIRGTERLLESSTTDPELLRSGSLTSFNSDGFTMGTDASYNTSPYNIVAWNWKANGSGVSNTDGSITSTVSANPDAGFSIVEWTHNGSTETIGHGLSQAPEFIITKPASATGNWLCYSKELGNNRGIYLNQAGGAISASNWNNTDPTSSVFAFSTGSSPTFIAYCFHSVEGYSKFGSYTGNGSLDGTFVHTGFRPAFVICKEKNNSFDWWMGDTAREPYNGGQGTYEWLRPNLSDAEVDYTAIEHLSNGFKFRDAHEGLNGNGREYIYMAFAEYPFKYANARGTSYDKTTGVAPSENTIGQSLRLNNDDSAYLTRSFGSGNRKTWTWSGWVKRGSFSEQFLFGVANAGNDSDYTNIQFFTGRLNFSNWNGTINLYSSAEFRDPSAWYHIVCAVDTTQATASERIRMYVNGNRITDWATANYPSQNQELPINNSVVHQIGARLTAGAVLTFDGYLADIYFIDGQALSADHFGYNDSTYGDWRPKAYSDGNPEADYGSNGFRLTFNSGSARIDQSGNGNHWTVNNFSETTDVVKDSPSNNFATLNPLVNCPYYLGEGNLMSNHNSSGWASRLGTIFANSGKWYWECKSSSTNNWTVVGVAQPQHRTSDSHMGAGSGLKGFGWVFNDTGNRGDITYNNINSYYTNGSIGLSDGDVLGIALDLDNNNIKFYKNNTKYFDISNALEDGAYYTFGISHYFGGTMIANFGQDSSFAGTKTAQGNQDSNGIGDFYYTPPTGFLALCSSNLPNPTVVPKENFNAVLYTGNNTNNLQSNISVGFQPDLLWIKNRDNVEQHHLMDSTRGENKFLFSSLSNAESTIAYNDPTGSVSVGFNSDGFDIVDSNVASGELFFGTRTYVAWNWKANGGTTSTNTDGSITSTVQANPDAGFSIVTWTGASSYPQTIGHGLGAQPACIIAKKRSSSGYWQVYNHKLNGLKDGDGYILMDLSAAYGTGSNGIWNSDTPTSTVFSTGFDSSVHGNGETFVAYCWKEVEGFSKFGVYTGNGSSDGPFIYTGFRPAFIITKKTSGSGNWRINDNARDVDNVVNHGLNANETQVDFTQDSADFLANGFKIRDSAGANDNGDTYIYMAFAEYPFKRTNAR